MSPATLPRGATLLLFPEDVEGAISTPTYVKVKSLRGATVSVQLDEASNGATQTLKLPRVTALTRRINLSDEGELQLGTWVRKAVCALVDREYRYGQVTGYSNSDLIVSTSHGPIQANLDAICGEVYPVIAMIMGWKQFPVSNWNYPALERMHEAMFTTIINPTNPGQGPPSVAQLLRDHDIHVSAVYDCLSLWTDALTGVRTRVSLQHVINHVYYVDGNAPLPPQLERAFGPSFCQQPTSEIIPSSNPDSQPRRNSQGNRNPNQRSVHNTSDFFDPTVVDDDIEVAADEASVAHMLLANEPSRSRQPTRTAPHTAADTTLLSTNQTPTPMEHESSQEHEIRELIRLHKPHLLPYHLDLRRPASSLPTATLTRRLDGELPPAKRTKFSFSPSLEQRRVHEVITAEAHKAYDFQFGSRGLSILHFTPVEQIERLRRQRENFISMSDISISAKFIPAPEPSSWDDVMAAANGFQQYCVFMCDSTTRDLATATYTLLGALRARNLWPQDQLPTLILWVDSQLEDYRNAIIADLTSLTSTRGQVSAAMNPFNPELQGILFSSQRDRMDPLQTAHDTPSREHSQQRSRSHPGRKGDSSTSVIPRHEGKQVRLKYLSKKGCPSSDPDTCVSPYGVHFFPAALTDKLKNYLRRGNGLTGSGTRNWTQQTKRTVTTSRAFLDFPTSATLSFKSNRGRVLECESFQGNPRSQRCTSESVLLKTSNIAPPSPDVDCNNHLRLRSAISAAAAQPFLRPTARVGVEQLFLRSPFQANVEQPSLRSCISTGVEQTSLRSVNSADVEQHTLGSTSVVNVEHHLSFIDRAKCPTWEDVRQKLQQLSDIDNAARINKLNETCTQLGIRPPVPVPLRQANGKYQLNGEKQRVVSTMALKHSLSLSEIVELIRGQTGQDPRPNKAWDPMRLTRLLDGYKHKSLLNDMARNGIQPTWKTAAPDQTNSVRNHRSASKYLNAVIKAIRSGQDAGQYLVLDIAVLEVWKEIQISPLGAVEKKDCDPDEEIRLVHDLSFRSGHSKNDQSSHDGVPELDYKSVVNIARRIEWCHRKYKGTLVRLMKGDVKGAFRHLMVGSGHVR